MTIHAPDRTVCQLTGFRVGDERWADDPEGDRIAADHLEYLRRNREENATDFDTFVNLTVSELAEARGHIRDQERELADLREIATRVDELETRNDELMRENARLRGQR